MYATIQKWGNSQGIRIPKSLLEALGICENDRVELLQEQDTITIKKADATTHKTLEDRLSSFYGKPVEEIGRIQSEEVVWGHAEGDEVW